MKKIGILGGVGPEATADIFLRIIRATPANNDQEHIPMIIVNNPQIPDRTKRILLNGEDPVPELSKTAKQLEASGADFVILPCNTAHYFVKEIQDSISIPIVDMIAETANFVKQNYPTLRKIGIVGTTGTVKTRIYEKAFSKHNIKVVAPDDTIQENVVMDSIYGTKGIKAGFYEQSKRRIENVGELLVSQGAELIIAACTEVSLVLKQENVPYLVIDPMTVLAEVSVERALTIKTINKGIESTETENKIIDFVEQ